MKEKREKESLNSGLLKKSQEDMMLNFQINILLILAFVGDAVRYPRMGMVMHSHGDAKNNSIVQFSVDTWLNDTQLLVIDGYDQTRRLQAYVRYDGNPGCGNDDDGCKGKATFKKIGRYYGAHRTMAGVLMANDTFSPDWIYVFDDDNYAKLDHIYDFLLTLDHNVPLLIAGTVGPRNRFGQCRSLSNATHWNCCTNLSAPCLASIDPVLLKEKQYVWKYSDTLETMVPDKECIPNTDLGGDCCHTVPWPSHIGKGYPYRYDEKGEDKPHFAYLWPYGGATYVLSRGMLQAIGREVWESCMYRIQCNNADQRIMTCVLNQGYSVSLEWKHLGSQTSHHIHSLHDMQRAAGYKPVSRTTR